MVPKEIKNIGDALWEIPTSFKKGMNVPARVYATKKLLDEMDEGVFNQITNVACLPGIQKYAICHADGHWGYGFPIGGVAAFDLEEGVISPGGIGFDINCGMRLIKTDLTIKEVEPKLRLLVDTLFDAVPAGVGCKGDLKLSNKEFEDVAHEGAKWAIENGHGWEKDVKNVEDNGKLDFADVSKVSQKAISRGLNQVGTLGSGNHYLEVQVNYATDVFNKEVAKKIGITQDNQVVVMVHCGSRGVGHQVASDYLKIFDHAMKKYNIKVNDRELACAPFQSKEGQDYYKAMACAANMAYANRQVITHKIRESFSKVFRQSPEDMGMDLIMDNTHNLARKFNYRENGKKKNVLVHLKGSTRSLGPNNEGVLPIHKEIGSLIVLGGSMETGSYLLVGTKKAEEESFGSTAHGAGRTMSRTKAKKLIRGDKLLKDMEKRGIYVRAKSMVGVAEESGAAYKEVDGVVDAINKAGISKPVLKLRPRGNCKG